MGSMAPIEPRRVLKIFMRIFLIGGGFPFDHGLKIECSHLMHHSNDPIESNHTMGISMDLFVPEVQTET